MYAKLEEEHGLAKRAMSIYERATQVVNNEDKFDVSRPLNFHCDIRARARLDVHHLHCKSY